MEIRIFEGKNYYLKSKYKYFNCIQINLELVPEQNEL